MGRTNDGGVVMVSGGGVLRQRLHRHRPARGPTPPPPPADCRARPTRPHLPPPREGAAVFTTEPLCAWLLTPPPSPHSTRRGGGLEGGDGHGARRPGTVCHAHSEFSSLEVPGEGQELPCAGLFRLARTIWVFG